MCAKANPSRESVQVILDADLTPQPLKIGVLHHASGRGQDVFSFEYDDDWLRRADAFQIDPDLQLHGGEVYPANTQGRFRVFMDSAPDRWGRVLLERREVMAARAEGRPPRTLTDWDFLLGVHDSCRMGALRFRRSASSPYLDNDRARSAPPVTSLRELEAAALAFEAAGASDHPEYRQWLTALLAPGTSLGGARPKANFTDADGSLWIAKFPSRQDRRDIGAWEYVTQLLGRSAGIEFPEARLLRLGGDYRTYASRRFDRTREGRRRFFVSALTLLQKDDGAGGSYLELAEFLNFRGSTHHIRDDLKRLWTRLVFNLAVGNRDDHLRNHGFILENGGWRLAPAYDVNPSPDQTEHALAIDEANPSPDLALALETSEYYGLEEPEARAIRDRVLGVVATWRTVAQQNGIPRGEIEQMSRAFVSDPN